MVVWIVLVVFVVFLLILVFDIFEGRGEIYFGNINSFFVGFGVYGCLFEIVVLCRIYV